MLHRTKLWRNRYSSQILFGMITLVVVLGLFTILRFIPIIQTFRYSFYKWALAAPKGRFLGFSNFISLVSDKAFLKAVKNTLIFYVGTTPTTIALSLLLAVLLTRGVSSSASKMYELLIFIPVVISMVPVSIVWKWIYDPSHGLLNYIISLVGIAPQAWLLDPKLAMPSVIAMSVWKGIGFYLVIFIVGLKSIPSDFFDAAAIDGANPWQRFWYITFPILKPITLFALVFSTIQNINVFTQMYIMTQSYGSTGTFGRAIPVIVFEIYNNGFKFRRMGYASAQSVVLFIIVLVISMLLLKTLRESD